MAARSGGDGEVLDFRLCIEDEVGDEELLSVDGVVEGETRKLQVASEKDPAR